MIIFMKHNPPIKYTLKSKYCLHTGVIIKNKSIRNQISLSPIGR